jgi:hypothetical protein
LSHSGRAHHQDEASAHHNASAHSSSPWRNNLSSRT